MEKKFCFVALEFIYDVNVLGYTYWYLSDNENIAVGDKVVAPLGRHNNEQVGIVRKVVFETAQNAPFKMEYIKRIRGLVSKEQ